jgi:hypothetical protein
VKRALRYGGAHKILSFGLEKLQLAASQYSGGDVSTINPRIKSLHE